MIFDWITKNTDDTIKKTLIEMVVVNLKRIDSIVSDIIKSKVTMRNNES